VPLVLLALAVLYAVTAGIAALPAASRHWRLAPSALLVASTALLVAYVLSEDDYRRGGISRWEAYGNQPAVQALFWLGLVLAAASLIAAARGRTGAGRLAAATLLGLGAVLAQLLASVGFTVN
jgi:hypothetical protein